MQGHLSPISGVACSAEALVATVGSDDRVVLWDARARRTIARAFHDHSVHACDFSPDGRLLATASGDRTARLWRVPDLRLVAVLHDHSDAVVAVAFRPDGARVATASRDGRVRVFDRKGELALSLRGHAAGATAVWWCAGGRELVSCGEDGAVRGWSGEDGALLRTVDLRDVDAGALAVAPDGTIFAGDLDGDLVVFGGGSARRLPAHAAGVERLALDARGRRLVSVARDRSVRVWALGGEGGLLPLYETRAPAAVSLRAAAFDAAGALVFGTFGSSFAACDPPSGRWDLSLVRDTPAVTAALQTREGVYTVGDAGVVRLNGRLFTRLPSPCAFLVGWDGRVYAGGQSGELFDARTGERVFSAGSPLTCATAATRRGASALVVGTAAGEGVVFERVGAEVRLAAQVRLHLRAVRSLASDGATLFSVGDDGGAAWHDLDALAPTRAAAGAHDRAATGAASLGAGAFASVSHDQSLRVWHADGSAERVRTPHAHPVTAVAACPETRRVATASDDGHVAVWSVDEGRWLHHDRPTSSGIASLARGARAGEFLAASYDGSVYRVGLDGRADVAVPVSRDTTGWTHTHAPRKDGTRVPVLRDRISEVSL